MDITIQGVNGHLKKQNKDSISISSKNKENLLLPDIGKHTVSGQFENS